MSEIIDTEQKNIEYYSEAIKKSANKDFTEFLKWFNGGNNITEIINSGYRNFYNLILKPYAYQKTKKNSKELNCLEIGCGGGRILNAACKYFGNATGIDIHDNFDMLEKFMKIENDNFELFKIKENKFPIADNSVDFVYSFIVFQHILKIEVFRKYISEIMRVMKKSGTAVIYFGRPRFLSRKNFNNLFLNFSTFAFDRIFYEGIYLNTFKKGYFENYNAKVNYVNLTVSIHCARKIFRNAGLKIIKKGYSKNKNTFGTQYYFIAEK